MLVIQSWQLENTGMITLYCSKEVSGSELNPFISSMYFRTCFSVKVYPKSADLILEPSVRLHSVQSVSLTVSKLQMSYLQQNMWFKGSTL